MPDELAEKVLAIVAEVKGVARDRVTEDKTFAELEIDSLDALNIVFALRGRVSYIGPR